MPELRQNFFTKEWVIIATERAKRPEDLAAKGLLAEDTENTLGAEFLRITPLRGWN